MVVKEQNIMVGYINYHLRQTTVSHGYWIDKVVSTPIFWNSIVWD